MAAEQYVLSHPLCFLINKFGKCQVKLLKSALIDFYSPEVLSDSKQQLLKDIGKLHSVSLPHVPMHRQGENRAARDVDDMFTLITAIDEAQNISLSDLPTYVSDNPDNVPSVRLYEGEFGVFVSMLEKLDSRLSLMESAISNIAQDVHNMRSKVASLDSGAQSIQQPPSSSLQVLRPGINSVNNQLAGCSVVSATASQSANTTVGPMTSGNSRISGLMNESADHVADRTVETSSQRTDWASLVSTPLIHSNRFGVLGTTDDEHTDGGLFEEQRSARVKRRRQASSQQNRQQNRQQREAGDSQQQRPAQRSRAPLMIGKSVASGVNVAAAKQIFKKAVFLVDNVSISHSADDIRSFVSSMAINVISCFEVKPRRRRNEEGDIDDRKAFRLCIRADDRDRLLDPSKWPNSIAISQWFFKAPPQASADKRRRLAGRDDEVVAAGAATHGGGQSVSTEHDDEETIPLDTTVVSVICANDGGV